MNCALSTKTGKSLNGIFMTGVSQTNQINRGDLARPHQHLAPECLADDAAAELLAAIQSCMHGIQEPGQEINGIPCEQIPA